MPCQHAILWHPESSPLHTGHGLQVLAQDNIQVQYFESILKVQPEEAAEQKAGVCHRACQGSLDPEAGWVHEVT